MKNGRFNIFENSDKKMEYCQIHYDNDLVFPFLKLEMHYKKILKVSLRVAKLVYSYIDNINLKNVK